MPKKKPPPSFENPDRRPFRDLPAEDQARLARAIVETRLSDAATVYGEPFTPPPLTGQGEQLFTSAKKRREAIESANQETLRNAKLVTVESGELVSKPFPAGHPLEPFLRQPVWPAKKKRRTGNPSGRPRKRPNQTELTRQDVSDQAAAAQRSRGEVIKEIAEGNEEEKIPKVHPSTIYRQMKRSPPPSK